MKQASVILSTKDHALTNISEAKEHSTNGFSMWRETGNPNFKRYKWSTWSIIKPYSKDISEVQWAFYKSTMDYLILALCIKEKKMKTKHKRRSKIYTYHMNETNPKTYRYLLKKNGMPSGASPSLDAWVSLNIYLGCLGHPQAWALASPPSPHIGTPSIFEHFIHTKLNRTFSGVSAYDKWNPIMYCSNIIV